MLEKNKALPGCQVEWKGRVSDGLTLCQIAHSRALELGSHFPSPGPAPADTVSQAPAWKPLVWVLHPGDEAGLLWGAAPGLACSAQRALHLLLGTKDFREGSGGGGRASSLKWEFNLQQKQMAVRLRPRRNWGPEEPRANPSDPGPLGTSTPEGP